MENFGMIIPQSFMMVHCGCELYVHFHYSKRVDDFIKWVDEGNLRQLKLDDTSIDVWVRISDICPLNPASLQEHFNEWLKLKDYSFTIHSYKPFTPNQ